MSHVPTNDELNQAIAEALGWRVDEGPLGCLYFSPPGWTHAIADESHYEFCTNRNLLPDVWATIRSANAVDKWFNEFDNIFRDADGHQVFPSIWSQITAEPRLHVIAALKALDKWPSDWSIELGESTGDDE